MSINRLVTPSDWNQPRFVRTAVAELGQITYYHRKLWEYVSTVHALEDVGMLDGKRIALGLGTGTEPLCFYFSRHCEMVHATDLFADSSNWQEARMSIADAYLQSPFAYRRERLQFRVMDMRSIDVEPESVDFVWSCSSIEHVPDTETYLSIFKGVERALKPGGYLVLTTEFNLLPRSRYLPDLILLDEPLLGRIERETNLRLTAPVDLTLEDHGYNIPFDLDYMSLLPSYHHLPHLWLARGDLLFTSVLLAFRKDPTLPGLQISGRWNEQLVTNCREQRMRFRRSLVHRIRPSPSFSHCGAQREIDGRLAVQSDGATGFLAYGPYLALPSGLYSAKMDVCIGDLADGSRGAGPICRLDVRYSRGETFKLLAERILSFEDVVVEQELIVPLNFESAGDGFIEFRIETLGRAQVTYFETLLDWQS